MDASTDAGGEVSLSIEETNKLRISLGLKPLSLDKQPGNAEKERQNHEAKKREEQAQAQAEELRRKIDAAREKRAMEAKLRSVKTLGAADDDDGDLMSWVEKNRQLEQQRKEEAARKASQASNKRKQRPQDSDDEEGYKAADLEGLKVRHDLGELGEGDTVIVTLADRSLLDERGNLAEGEDELENTLLAEEKKRRKALKAATKQAKPLWEEDGKVRTILDKYDEEEEEVVVALGTGGTLAADAERRRQEQMRKKLAAGAAILDKTDGAGNGAGTSGDYYTAAEMAAFSKPKKKKKGERRLRAKSAEPQEGADILAALEAQAEEAAANGGAGGDLGRRADRGAAAAKAEEVARIAAEEKRARFDAALQKANWASQFLRPTKAGASGSGASAAPALGDDEDADRDLRESLERARRMAAKKKQEEDEERARAAAAQGEGGTGDVEMKAEGEEGEEAKPVVKREGGSVEEVARQAAARREAEGGKGGKAGGIGAMFAGIGVKTEPGEQPAGEMLTETMEFVRNIATAPQGPAQAAAKTAPSRASPDGTTTAGGAASVRTAGAGAYAQEGSDLDEDDEAGPGPGSRGRSAEPAGARTGEWVTAEQMDAEGGDGDGGGGGGGGKRRRREGSEARERTPAELLDTGVTGERAVGRGLAGALGLLNEKGALKTQVEWSGRNNDKSKVATIGLDEVYTGGRGDDRVARSVEAALTIRDKYGRVLTPKERFRQQCYAFHGIKPSKNQIDKYAARDARELASQKAASSEDPCAELDRLRAVQRATGSAYVVLSGKQAGLPAGAPGIKPDHDDDDAPRRRKAQPAKGGKAGGPPGGGPVHPLAGVAGGRGTVGNLTPLLGDKKVEAMYGITKPPKPPGK